MSELTRVSWQGRRAVIAFDSDVIRKADVKAAISSLADKLRDEGADVRVILLPDLEGHEKTGLDDFLVARGAAALQSLLDSAGDWFSALLGMLPRGLAGDALDAELRPIYEQAEKSDVAGKELRLSQLRQKLKDLGYPAPPMPDLKRAARNAAARGRQDGVLLDRNNQPLARESTTEATRQVKIGEVNRKAFRIAYRTLMQGWL